MASDLDVRRTIAYPDGDVHMIRVYLQGDATLVVEAAMQKLSARLGRPVSPGSLLELLAADYLSGP